MSHSELAKTFTDIQSSLQNYILSPDISIHNFQLEILPRKPKLQRLYDVPGCPASTTLIPKRNPVTGEVIDFIEVPNENAEENAQNSTSLRRMPNPLDESIRGSILNHPFWPGGFDEPKSDIEQLKTDTFDFGSELLTVPPDFEIGHTFDDDINNEFNDDILKNNSEVNLLQALEDMSIKFDKWITDSNDKEKDDEKVVEIDQSNQLDIDTSILKDDINYAPIIEISKAKIKSIRIASQWVEEIDVAEPVTDFEEKIPEPAKVFPFELDTFQKQAILQLENHEYVFVAAHTSAGKTVVAEYAIALSKRHMTRTIYTSPIKALSNQKYRDFKKEFGDVGLITGDMQIEPTASCLIMTTEILRSMLYCGSDVTRDLEYVILDEVHYINDVERGHVWEEVLILLPNHVTVIMLSATVPNTVEFADWIGNIKKRKIYVISTYKRPVPLMHYIYTPELNKNPKENFYCIVDSESRFLFNNYSEAEHKWNLKQGEIFKSFKDKKSKRRIWNTLIDYLKRDNKLPVIIFVLSRKRCDEIAQLISVDLNTPEEKNELRKFFSHCLKKLKTPDRVLPQILWMKVVLEKGIGVHHSGILPILKEIVEMCFQRGLVKVLFATETFAMGVNMPAKTVVFDSIKKYDGLDTRHLKPAEYIQMAGRAGRRGHDKNGMVVIMCNTPHYPSHNDIRSMIIEKPEKLDSKFVLRYAMILRCLRTESLKVENIMSHSYSENGFTQNILLHEKELQKEKEKYSKLQEIGDNLKPLSQYYDLAIEYLENYENLMEKLLSNKNLAKLLVPGRVIIVNYEKHYNKLGILLSIKNSNLKVLVLDHKCINDEEENWNKVTNDRDELWNKLLSLLPQNKYFKPKGLGGHNVLDITLSNITHVTKHFIKIDADNIIQNWIQRQMERFKNDPPNQKVANAVTELRLLNDEYISSSLKFIDFEDYLNLESLTIIEKVNNLKNTLNELQPDTNISNFENNFHDIHERKVLKKKIDDLELKKSWKSLKLYPDYCSRLKVLKELGFVNKDDEEVELKGKIACEMGQNEIILTELISNNIIHGLSNAEIAALLSSLVFQVQIKDFIIPEVNKNLEKAINDMIDISEKIQDAELLHGVGSAEHRERLNFGLVEVVYEWARNKPFAQIMTLTDVQEGIIVRCIQQLDELIRDVKTAARRIGDPTLENKMEKVSEAIRRDIVFAASLYTTLED